MQAATHRIAVNGVALNVVVAGEGPDVLMVHGFPDDHALWRRQIPALVSAGYRVITPDTRGCGESEVPPHVGDYATDTLVADLVGLLDVLGIGKVRLVGHDWGAVQGWQVALRHPERVDRYVAMSVGHPAMYARGGLEQRLRGYYVHLFKLRGLVEFLAPRFDWLVFRMMAGYPEEFPRWKSLLSRPGRLTAGLNYYRANYRLLLGGDGRRAQVPVAGIWSSGDRFLAERQMRDSGQYCDAGWSYHRIEGANHWMQLTAPDAVTALLIELLR